MTLSEIGWAACHVWFVRAFDGGVVVVDDVAGELPMLREFSDFKALQKWAGY